MQITRSEIESTGERWLFALPATSDQISAAERELQLAIPNELKELLALSNGMKLPHPVIDDPVEAEEHAFEILFGLEKQILETKHFRSNWLHDGEPNNVPYAVQLNQFLIVAEDGNGNSIAYSSLGREDGMWGLGLLDHETREFAPWDDYGLLDLLSDIHW